MDVLAPKIPQNVEGQLLCAPFEKVYKVTSLCFPSTTSYTTSPSWWRSCMITPGTMRPPNTVEIRPQGNGDFHA